MDVINSEAKRNVLRKLILVRLCFASRAAVSEGQGQNGHCGKAGNARAQPSGGGRLPSTGVPSTALTAHGRQIQWLCSQARGCRTAGQRMKQRQEGRGCETLEKRALQGPGTKAKARLRCSGRTRAKRQTEASGCTVCQTGSDCPDAERDLLQITICIIIHASSKAYRECLSEMLALPIKNDSEVFQLYLAHQAHFY